KGEPPLLSARIILPILLTTALAGVSQVQDSGSNNSVPAASAATSTPAKEEASHKDRVILKVGGVSVTEGEFESGIGEIEPQGGGDPDNPGQTEKNRRRLGDDYASVLMLSQQAVASHVDATPEIRRKLAVARLQILSDAEFGKLMSQTRPSPE